MKRNGFGKLIFGALLLAVMLLALPSAALADGEEFTVTTSVSGGYTYADGVLTINKGGAYTIGMADGVTQTTHKIVVNTQGVYNDTKSITLTLSNLNMLADSGNNISFLGLNVIDVNIVIDGENTVKNTKNSSNNSEGSCFQGSNKADMIITGNGKLTLDAADDAAQWSANSITLNSENVILDLKSHCITTQDGVYISAGELNIESSQPCIYTNGELYMTGGTLNATSTGAYCIQIYDVESQNNLKGAGFEIRGGDVTLTTTGTTQSIAPIYLMPGRFEKSIVINTTGTVTLENKGKGVSGIFLYGKAKNFTMAGGKLIIKGYPRGIWRYVGSSGGLNFNGGETEIICTTANAIYGVGSGTYGGSHTTDWASTYKHKNYVGTADKPEEVPDSSVVNNSSSKYKYLLITPAYDIEYELNSGIVLPPDANPATYSRVDKFTLTNPTRYLYNFSGWTGSNGTTPQTEVTIDGSVATGKRTYTANWDGQPFTVYFFSNFEPGTYQTQTFKYGEEKALNANPFTREGYDFIGWNTVGQPTSDNPGTSYADKGNLLINTALDENQLKLWAQWRIRSHTISYTYSTPAPAGAPGVPASATVAYGSGQTVAAAPTLTGYTFSGWSGKTKTNGDTVAVDGNNAFTMPDDDVEFTGSWTANTYTVVFHANNGTTATSSQSFNYNEEKALTENAFTNGGYGFTGWNTVANPTSDNPGVAYTDKQSVKNLTAENNGTIDLYGQWSANQHTVSYAYSDPVPDGAPAVPASATVDYGTSQNVAAASTLTGYTFSGWSGKTKADGAAVTVDANNTFTMPDDDVEFTGAWTINTYTVVFHANNGTTATTSQSFVYDEEKALTTNAFTYGGYGFTGWNTIANPTSDNPGVAYTDKQSVKNLTAENNGTIDLYGQWSANQHTVSYAYSDPAPDGAPAVPANVTVSYGVSQNVAAAPTLTGYTFSGWSGKTKTDGAAVTVDANNAFTMPDDDVEFTGAWTANTYTVTLVTNGGAINSGNVTGYTYGVGATLPADVTQTGHTFLGWFDNEGLTGTPVTAISTEETGDRQYWAKWGINQHTITFMNEDGTVLQSSLMNYGDTPAYTGNTPVKAGDDQYTYTFAGWNNGTATYGTEQALPSVTADATYTAVFSNGINKYQITFVDEDGTTVLLAAAEYEYGTPAESIVKPADPTKEETDQYTYTFAEWTPEITAVEGNKTYKATYTNTPRTYTVTLNTNGGAINSGNLTSYTYGVGATLPADVTQTGHTFLGWFDNEGLTGTPVTAISTEETGDKEFWAKWTPIAYAIIVTDSANGSVAVKAGETADATTAFMDDTVTLTLTPDTGYELLTLTVDGEDKTGEISGNVYSFTMPAHDVTVTVTYTSVPIATHTLTINYVYEDNRPAAETHIETLAEGAEYAVVSPAIEGFTPDQGTVSGAMGTADVTVTVTYTANPIATHTLTINYVYEDNRPAAETHIETLTEGAEYAVVSPAIEGFTPDQDNVSGTMGTADVTVTVTYTANPIATHTLTINYVYEDNRPAAETHIETLAEGAEYAVASPAIEGFTPDQGTVAGTMGTADVIVTVTYTANPKPVIYYSVVEGNGQTYVRRSNVPLEFKVVRNIDDEKAYGLFRALKRDGTAVAEQYFTKEPGSVIVTLTPEYLEGLVLGEHTLTFVFEDGEAEAHFFVKPVPGSFEDVAIPSNTFTFRKVWEGGSEKSIDFTLYKLGGTVYHHGFNKKIINKSEWQYNAWFSEAAACYVIEEPVEGYKTRYENVGVYAGITDRCCDGGTIVNYKVPKTGDDANPFLWVGCVLVGLTIISVSAYAGKRKKAHSK